jgi:hypothetical protein
MYKKQTNAHYYGSLLVYLLILNKEYENAWYRSLNLKIGMCSSP